MTHSEARDLLDHFRQDAVVTEQYTIHVELQIDRNQRRRQVEIETRWTRDRIIGSGAFGDVWLESKQRLEEDGRAMRAVKVISKRRMQDWRIDYEKELLALAKFSKRSYQQENVLVEFFGWYEDKSHLYISMEYFELGDLSQHISSSLSEEDVKQITTDLLHGLRIVHQEKFAHRDLKPKNIFVVQKPPVSCWWVKIGDFGISKRARGDTELHTEIGTALYKAPEISGYYESTKNLYGYDQAVDMWSLGCVVFELLTQTVPFEDALSILKFCDGKLPFPEDELLLKVGLEGTAFVRSLIQANPRHRLTASDALESPWIIQENQLRPALSDIHDLKIEEKEDILRMAARTGDMNKVQHLLNQGVDINAVDAQNQTALNLASYNGQTKVAEYLMQNDASFQILNLEGNSPWHSAVMNSRPEIIRLFVRERFETYAKNNDGYTPLGLAIIEGHLELIKLFLQSGARIKEKKAECCLNLAVIAGKTETVQLLLKGSTGFVAASKSCRISALVLAAAFGRQVIFHLLAETIGCDVKNEDGLTPLIIAAATGQQEMVEYLLLGTHLNDVVVADSSSEFASDAISCLLRPRSVITGGEILELGSPHSRQLFPHSRLQSSKPLNDYGFTPLDAACRTGRLPIVQLLLQHGADPNVANLTGFIPLHQAIYGIHPETVRLLLETGSDPYAVNIKGMTPLHCAAVGGDIDIIKSLLELGATLQSDSTGRNALHKCARYGHIEALKLLLAKFDKDANESNRFGVTLLHAAAENGSIDTVKFLVRKGANVNAASIDKWTPLHNAASKGHIDIVAFLIDNGASINIKSGSGITPLHDAASTGQTSTIKFLLNRGAHLNELSSQHETPLYLAVRHGHFHAAQLLLKRNPDLTVKTNENEITLQRAIASGSIEISRLLLEKGADRHFYDHMRLTPLMYSLQFTDRKMTRFLIDQRVDDAVLSVDGKTALQVAICWGNLDGVEGLLKKGVDPNSNSSTYSLSPLYLAADAKSVNMVRLLLGVGAHDTTRNRATLNVAILKGPPKIVELLLDKGTDANADMSESGLKPLHKASFLGNVEAVRLLLAAGADIHLADTWGYTALHHAVQYNRSKVVEVLLELGADAGRRSKNGVSALDLASQGGRRASMNVFKSRGFIVEGGHS
ncbi:uncharacterized protein N7469_004167 [Penicillium citrinum]|uniref:Protein kinase domain-containing protein n=1 Tax=Penicillium citrinum TaxID=5077 RepID=A0A9W9TS22_PENCI|nr:uncharacterized protein N7469_004167 [Penicillium citrinum]KAJ5234999.1 hypothetical protein N7469_004167 [Penicillium citrinum]